MSLLAYKIKEDHFRIADLTCGLRAVQIVHRSGLIPLIIDITVSNAVTPDIKKKGKPIAGVIAIIKAKIPRYQNIKQRVQPLDSHSCLKLSSHKAVLERGSSAIWIGWS